MKLAFCPDCGDMLVLKRYVRKCQCGKIRGKYKSDGWHAWVEGDPMVFGINNKDIKRIFFERALKGRVLDNTVEAWYMDENAERVERR